jgi:transcriptional regulator with XRE-family HTH domain
MSRLEFAAKLDISNAVLSHLASGRNKASLDLVIAVLNNFPKINAEWLILNKGEMYKSEIDDREALKSELMGQIQALLTTNQKMTGQLQNFVKSVEDLK